MTDEPSKGQELRCSKCSDGPLIVSPNDKGAACRCPDCELLKIKDREIAELRSLRDDLIANCNKIREERNEAQREVRELKAENADLVFKNESQRLRIESLESNLRGGREVISQGYAILNREGDVVNYSCFVTKRLDPEFTVIPAIIIKAPGGGK